MSDRSIHLLIRSWDHIAPLLAGDVQPEGIELTLDRTASISELMTDARYDAGETSLSRHVIRLAQGDHSFIALPVFPMRAFRHRGFFAMRDSGLRSLKDLAGKRVGTNGWADTGNTWGRSALREQGVALDSIEWLVGPMGIPMFDHMTPESLRAMPSYVRVAPDGRTVVDMLRAGELDAVMVPGVPPGFYDADSGIVRVLEDYRGVELDYLRNVGFVPGHHIVAMRRESFERNPEGAAQLFDVLERSRSHWRRQRLFLADTSPWLLTDLEQLDNALDYEWDAYGTTPNRAMVETFVEESHLQGLIPEPLDPARVFAEFDALRPS